MRESGEGYGHGDVGTDGSAAVDMACGGGVGEACVAEVHGQEVAGEREEDVTRGGAGVGEVLVPAVEGRGVADGGGVRAGGRDEEDSCCRGEGDDTFEHGLFLLFASLSDFVDKGQQGLASLRGSLLRMPDVFCFMCKAYAPAQGSGNRGNVIVLSMRHFECSRLKWIATLLMTLDLTGF